MHVRSLITLFFLFVGRTDCCVTADGVTLDCCLAEVVPSPPTEDDPNQNPGGDDENEDPEASKSNKGDTETGDENSKTGEEDDADEVRVRRRRKAVEGKMRFCDILMEFEFFTTHYPTCRPVLQHFQSNLQRAR
jgi:hypothetical protein